MTTHIRRAEPADAAAITALGLHALQHRGHVAELGQPAQQQISGGPQQITTDRESK